MSKPIDHKRITIGRILLLALLLALVPGLAPAYQFSLVTTDSDGTLQAQFDRGDTLVIDIAIDDPAGVAACAFTLNYPAQALVAPATTATGTPAVAGAITSPLPFAHHRENSSEAGKIYFSGAAIDPAHGGALPRTGTAVLFRIAFTVKDMPPRGDFRFTLTQTDIFRPVAGYGSDHNGNGLFDEGTDTKGRVPILVGAKADSEAGYGDLACSAPACAFPGLMPDVDGLLAETWFNLTDGDTDGDGLLDSVETDTGVFVDASDTGTDPLTADTDGDGMPDGWEAGHGLNPVADDATADLDNDGLTNLEEYQQGTDPSNARPAAPALNAPRDGATAVSLQPTLETGPFSDADASDTHARTEWQVSRVFGSFTDPSLVFKTRSATRLTTLTLPRFILLPGTDYYWRARYVDHRGEPGPWSVFFAFTTQGTDPEDLNADGMIDAFEVDPATDLDGDGTPDIRQPGIKPIRSIDRTASLAVKKMANVVSMDAVGVSDPDTILDKTGRPGQMPMGLISFKITVAAPGATARVTVYFSKPVPGNARWYKYDLAAGWQDFSANAVFSDDRRSVLLSLQDGGAGDGDGTANGVIIDPSGPAVVADGSGSAGTGAIGCFIATAAHGSRMAPQVKILRQFRDAFLLKTTSGRAFVRTYYRHSPPLADAIAQREWLRTAVRLGLLPLVGASYLALAVGVWPMAVILFAGFALAGSAAVRIFRRRTAR